jgi:hypothetical protein
MPVKRTRLVRAQQARYLARAHELQAARVDCEIPDEWQENSLSVDIFVAPPQGNVLIELRTGVTACAIWMQIVALSSNLILEDFRIVSEWGSELITVCDDQSGLYRVGTAVEFTAHQALNHRIENGLHLRRRGDVAEGWLLASDQKPIPDKYRNWMTTELRLTFTDQFGHDHSAQAKATLERSARFGNSRCRARKSARLFEAERPENEISFRGTTANTRKGQPRGRGGPQHQTGPTA